MLIHRILIINFLFLLGSCCTAQESNNRLAESPYPFSSKPDTLYLTSENYSYAEKVSLNSLMGLLAKTKPRILRDANNIRQLVTESGIVISDSFYIDYPGLVKRFANQVSGY